MKVLLSAKTLADPPPLPPGKKKLVLVDSRQPGLVVEFGAHGATLYTRYKNAAGKTRWYKLGRYGTDLTLDQARKRHQEVRGRVAAGQDPAVEREQSRQALTLAEFAETRFLPHQRARKRSWREDEKLLAKRVLPALGRKMLGDVTTADIHRLHDGVVSEGRTPATANRVLAVTKRCFALAVLWGDVEKDPAKPVKLFRENSDRARFLSLTELRALVQALEEDPDRVAAAMVVFLAVTGCRFGEAVRAKWADIDRERAIWTLPTTKAGRRQHKPLSSGALALLDGVAREQGNDHVFPGTRPGEPRRCVRTTWARACARAGLARLRLHDLRHTYASLQVAHGESLYVVQQLLGPSSPSMTMRYAHFAPDHLAGATERVGQLVWGG